MTLALIQIEMLIPGSASLKDKRMVLKRVKDRLCNKFNVSVAETDYHDKWQRSLLAIALVSGDKKFAEQCVQKIFTFLDSGVEFEIVKHQIEYL